MKINLQTVAKVAISLAALAIVVLVLRGVNVTAAWEILRTANPLFLVLVLAAQGVGIFLRLVRWREMLRPKRLIPLKTLVSPLIISYMVGNVTVTGVGAVPRVYLVNRRTGVEAGFITGTWILEYLLDASFLLFWAVMVPFLVNVPPQFRQIQIVLAIPLIIVLLIGVALWRRQSFLLDGLKRQGWWDGLLARLPWNGGAQVNSFGDGLTASFARARTGWAVVLITAIIWAVEAVIFWLLLLSLNGVFGLVDASAVATYTYLVTGVPSVPGFIGTLEVSTVSLILALGGTQALALAYVVLLRVFFMGPTTVVGLILASRDGWSLNRLLSRKAGAGQADLVPPD